MSKEQTKNVSKVLTVNTTYARAAVMLLAFNFLLTGYLLHAFMEVQTDQSNGESYAPPVIQADTLATTKEEGATE
jgi:hypothetical protein